MSTSYHTWFKTLILEVNKILLQSIGSNRPENSEVNLDSKGSGTDNSDIGNHWFR